METINLKRGEIWLVDLDPTKGHEIRKRRPVVVLSSDSIGSIGLRIGIPVTSYRPKHAKFPWCVPLKANARNRLDNDSTADAYQIKCVSTERFIHRIGTLSAETVKLIAEAVALCIDL